MTVGKSNAGHIVRILQRQYKVGTWRERPFRALIGCIISQRNRDEVTEKVSDALLRRANTPEKMLKLGRKGIAKIIHPANFYKTKAKHIYESTRMLQREFDGRVPKTRKELMELPGVGQKTADIVLMYGFGIPSIAIDTHVNRISKRIGFVSEKAKLEEVKNVLESLIPEKEWFLVNILFVTHGQNICLPRNPRCPVCPIKKLCRYYRLVFLKLQKEVPSK